MTNSTNSTNPFDPASEELTNNSKPSTSDVQPQPAESDETLNVSDANEIEDLFKHLLSESNSLSKQTTMTEDVAKAKMLNFCIRMLHSEGWMPQTVIRAMVLKECDPELAMRKAMWQAFRERRTEMRTQKIV